MINNLKNEDMKNSNTKFQVIEKQNNGFIEEDSWTIIKAGVYLQLTGVSEFNSYNGICGGLIEGAHQWWDHNDVDVEHVENEKWHGLIVTTGSLYHERYEHKLVIRKHIWHFVNYEAKNWTHAYNTFKKHLTKVGETRQVG